MLFDERFGLGDFAAGGFVAVVDAAAAGGALGVGVHENAATAIAECVADVEGHAAGADDGNT